MQSGRFQAFRRRGSAFWRAVSHWFQLNSRTPGWLPAWLSRPLARYPLCVLLLMLAIALNLLILHFFPTFDFYDLPVTLVVLSVALTWGAGEGLFATLLGTFLLYYVIYPPPFVLLWKNLVDMLQNAGVIIAGLIITLSVSYHDAQVRNAQQAAQEEAETRKKMDAFLVITSHELKTPLTTIRLYLQLAQRRLHQGLQSEDSSAACLQSLLKALGEQIDATLDQWARLNLLVDDLLEMSRIQADKMAFSLQPVDLLPLIKTVVEEQRQAAPDRTIHLLLPPEPSLLVTADPYRLEQVPRNYLANALKYSPETSLVTVGIEAQAGQARVWVRDQGPGLAPEEHERIWERFYRVPGIEVQSGSGMGLGIGLYLCRAIIEGQHGQVGLESAPGLGSTFWCSLPLAEQPGD